MSLNRRANTLNIRALRGLVLALLTAALAACASASHKADFDKPPPAVTPTEQFKAEATGHPDQILLAPHAEGVSMNQAAALAKLVDRWRDSGGGPIIIQAASHGGAAAYTAAAAVQAELEALGVRDDQIELGGYAGDESPQAPVVVGFEHYVADVPQCGRNWTSFTTDMGNGPNSNFGCAVTADIAAMAANPADLAQPRQMDPADAGRRETVITKYRAGSITSSAKDDQADTQISDAVQ